MYMLDFGPRLLDFEMCMLDVQNAHVGFWGRDCWILTLACWMFKMYMSDLGDAIVGFANVRVGPPRAPPEPPGADPDLHSLAGPPELSRDAFLSFSWMSHLKHLVSTAFLAGNPSKYALTSRCFS